MDLFLNCTDQTMLLIYQAVVSKARELQDERDEQLAIRIANNVSKTLSG